MTKQAEQLERALAALVRAVDRYQEHVRSHPEDSSGLGRLGAQVDQASVFFPAHITSTIMTHLSDSQDVLVSAE